MYKKLRVICAIISALFLVIILPVATFWGLNGFAVCGFGAGLFFFLTLIFKKMQGKWEEKHGIPHDMPSVAPNAEENAAQNPENIENDNDEKEKRDETEEK